MRALRWAMLVSVAGLLAGCAPLGYYWQSVSGHLDMVRAARPVQDWLDDPATPADLRERLQLAQQMRVFAVTELALPDNASYRRYADLKRPAAVWNVVATTELSLELKTWCFPVLGCVGYRGYFDRAQADALAAELKAQGWETYVYGVPAYSTLGKLPGDWLADPLLNTFVKGGEVELARLIFHELAHQVAYAQDDTRFNESFATAVERIGSDRWMRQRADPALRQGAELDDRRRAQFRELAMSAREELLQVYRSSATDEARRQGRREVLERLRQRHQALKAGEWQGYTGYDRWFATVGNPQLALLSAYHSGVADFERLFERQGREFPRFYAEVRRLAALPKAAREAVLRQP
jgi:predicted aminopeptidase